MSVFLSPVGGAGAQFFDNNGNPLTGGKLYTYAAGTTTPQVTYTTSTGNVTHANPIIFDSAGRVAGSSEIWLTSGASYKFTLKDSNDVLIGTWDNINGNGDPSYSYYTPASTSLLAPGPLTIKSALDQITNEDSGSSVIGYLPPFTGSVATNLEAKLAQFISVKDFGATGDGTTDDTAAIQAALNAAPEYCTVFFPYGNYIISNELVIPTSNLLITGRAKITAKAGAQFEFMLKATSLNGITVENLRFDANKDNRISGATTRFMGVIYSGCTECQFINLRVENCRGYNGISGVGIAAAGQSIRCRIDGCTIINCGDAGNSPATDADAIFTSGEQNVISNCIAANCTDTGFVIESSNQSVITGCTSRLCGAGAGITSANASDKGGNVIDGLTVFNWYGSVGAVQIGVPGNYAGNLINNTVSNVIVIAETPTYGTPGPAINISGVSGFGEVQGLTMSNIRIRGAATQGIIVQRGQGVHIHNAYIVATTDACIQFNTGTDHMVTNSYLNGPGSFGIFAGGTSEVFTSGNVFNGVGYAISVGATASVTSMNNIIKSTTVAKWDIAVGATFNALGALGNDFMINNASGSATSGSVVNKFQIVNRNGTILGYVPVYNA
jgi:parallel beta-helix repeat protein